MKLAIALCLPALCLPAIEPIRPPHASTPSDSRQNEQEAQADEHLDEVGAEVKQRARAVLDAVSKRLEKVKVMRASYAQERTSPLLIEPLRSSGRLFQRTDPACIVFHIAAPHPAQIRVDASTYQVYRPDEGTAERFLFEGAHAGRALLDSLRPEADTLFGAFALIEFEQADHAARLKLRPRDKKARKHVDNVILRLDTENSVPAGVSYVDREGYEVTLTLSDVSLDPELDDAKKLFAADLPDDVRVLVHRIKDE